jgi:hypothetical protein
MIANVSKQISENKKNEAIKRNFIESITSKATARRYNEMLFYFTKYVKTINLSDFLKWDDQTIKDTYLLYLKQEKKVSYSYRSLSFSAIKHFYEMNDITLP